MYRRFQITERTSEENWLAVSCIVKWYPVFRGADASCTCMSWFRLWHSMIYVFSQIGEDIWRQTLCLQVALPFSNLYAAPLLASHVSIRTWQNAAQPLCVCACVRQTKSTSQQQPKLLLSWTVLIHYFSPTFALQSQNEPQCWSSWSGTHKTDSASRQEWIWNAFEARKRPGKQHTLISKSQNCIDNFLFRNLKMTLPSLLVFLHGTCSSVITRSCKLMRALSNNCVVASFCIHLTLLR